MTCDLDNLNVSIYLPVLIIVLKIQTSRTVRSIPCFRSCNKRQKLNPVLSIHRNENYDLHRKSTRYPLLCLASCVTRVKGGGGGEGWGWGDLKASVRGGLYVPRLNFKPFHIAISEGSHVAVGISSKATDIDIGNV